MVWIRVLTEVCRWEIRNPGNVHGVPNCPPTPEPAEVIPNLIYLISELQRAPAQKIMKHISVEAPVAYGSYCHGSFMRTSFTLVRARSLSALASGNEFPQMACLSVYPFGRPSKADRVMLSSGFAQIPALSIDIFYS